MVKVSNTTTNGIVSSEIITTIIQEVNRINNWLNKLGYENDSDGLLKTYSRWKGQTAAQAKQYTKGADDFKVFSARVASTLQKGKTRHDAVTIKVPAGVDYSNAVATILCKDYPAYASVKEITRSDITIDVSTAAAPTKSYDIEVMLIAIAMDNNPND